MSCNMYDARVVRIIFYLFFANIRLLQANASRPYNETRFEFQLFCRLPFAHDHSF